MSKNKQNKMELAEKSAGSNYTLSNGFLGGKLLKMMMKYSARESFVVQ